MKISITLPLPHKSLSPNYKPVTRGGRIGQSVNAKKYHQLAKMLTTKEMRDRNIDGPWPAANIECTFYHKCIRTRDKDNANGSMKHAFDGIAAAGIVTNDTHFTPLPPTLLISKDRPRVEIEITRKEVKP